MREDGDSRRPRTTKNVYFFKAGDQRFTGIRLPVNVRKYRNLDAILDDLSFRIPLARGARTLSTPGGRDRITDLSQLRHNGSYICSDLIQARRVPGVNLSKIKGLSDPQLISSLSSSAFYEDTGAPPKLLDVVRKAVKKKKKKRKKKAERSEDQNGLLETQEAEGYGATSAYVAMLQEQILKTERSPSPDLEQQDLLRQLQKRSTVDQPLDDYPDGQVWTRSREVADREDAELEELLEQEEFEAMEKERAREEDYGGVYVGEEDPEGNQSKKPTDPADPDAGPQIKRVGSASRSVSKLGTSVTRPPTRTALIRSDSEEQKDLPPLDGKKLTHVQRRRLASNQVDPDRYTLPSESSDSHSGHGDYTSTGHVFRSSSPNDQRAKSKDDVSSLRLDELLSLSDEPGTIASKERVPKEPPSTKPQSQVVQASKEMPKRDIQSRQTDSGVSLRA